MKTQALPTHPYRADHDQTSHNLHPVGKHAPPEGIASRVHATPYTIRRAGVIGAIMIFLIMLGFMAIVGRIIQLQVQPEPPIAALIDSQYSRQLLTARRGSLFDRHGRVLATSRMAQVLFVDPQLIEDPNTFSEDLGYALGYDPAWLEQKISRRSNRRWVPIDLELSQQRIKVLRQASWPAVGTQPRLVRDYPQGHRAGQVIGFVGHAGNGLDGLEWVLDRELSGTDGSLHYVRDSRRRALWVSDRHYRAPANGRSIRLTIDLTIQAIAEDILEQTCRQFSAASGQIIVTGVPNGHVLAMANFPFFNPNDVLQSPPEVRRNRCVTDIFEPGSIFKPFIWATAIETETVRKGEIIDCTTSGYYVSPRRRRLRDTRGHGSITSESVLILSSNIGMAIIGQRLGAGRMHDALIRFNFGTSTYCGLPGEGNGIVNSLPQWNHYSVTSVPMGQEVATTGIQIMHAFSALANDGLMFKPRILIPDDGSAVKPITKRVLSKPSSQLTRQTLHRVVTEGTGTRANSDLYEIFGKTGTAQVADRVKGGYLTDQYVASFVAGAPFKNPRIIVGCFIHRPSKSIGYYGGTVAAPATKDVIERTLAYLGEIPQHNDANRSTQFVRR